MATEGVALDVALSICDAAINGRQDEASYLDSRGFVLLRLGRYDEAIVAYDHALGIRTIAGSFYGRGLAKRSKGDSHRGDADIRSAMLLDADIAETFSGYGITP